MLTDADIEKLKAVFATKDDLVHMKKEIIDDIADMIENKIVKILNEHEMRLDRLEKRVGGFPPIA